MSENQNCSDYSRYDAMTTEELEEILRLDAEMLQGQAEDEEIILYAMDILARRKQNSSNSGITVQQAWDSFQKNYLPREEDNIQSDMRTEPAAKAPRLWLRRVMAAAAVLVILIGVPLTAKAFGWDELWDAVAKWTKETFSFVSGEGDRFTEPAVTDIREYTSLQELLVETGQEYDFIPTWIPDGYELGKISMTENPMQRNYVAYYHNGETPLSISVKSFVMEDPEKVEINENLIELIEYAGVEYYVFSNLEQIQVIWVRDSYQCIISGDLTVDEIQPMIKSIGKV